MLPMLRSTLPLTSGTSSKTRLCRLAWSPEIRSSCWMISRVNAISSASRTKTTPFWGGFDLINWWNGQGTGTSRRNLEAGLRDRASARESERHRGPVGGPWLGSGDRGRERPRYFAGSTEGYRPPSVRHVCGQPADEARRPVAQRLRVRQGHRVQELEARYAEGHRGRVERARSVLRDRLRGAEPRAHDGRQPVRAVRQEQEVVYTHPAPGSHRAAGGS